MLKKDLTGPTLLEMSDFHGSQILARVCNSNGRMQGSFSGAEVSVSSREVLNLLNLVLAQFDVILEEGLEVRTALRPARYDGAGDQIGVRQRSA